MLNDDKYIKILNKIQYKLILSIIIIIIQYINEYKELIDKDIVNEQSLNELDILYKSINKDQIISNINKNKLNLIKLYNIYKINSWIEYLHGSIHETDEHIIYTHNSMINIINTIKNNIRDKKSNNESLLDFIKKYSLSRHIIITIIINIISNSDNKINKINYMYKIYFLYDKYLKSKLKILNNLKSIISIIIEIFNVHTSRRKKILLYIEIMNNEYTQKLKYINTINIKLNSYEKNIYNDTINSDDINITNNLEMLDRLLINISDVINNDYNKDDYQDYYNYIINKYEKIFNTTLIMEKLDPLKIDVTKKLDDEYYYLFQESQNQHRSKYKYLKYKLKYLHKLYKN